MINKSAFAWNDSLKCIEVDNDEAWNTYVQHNKDVDDWRGKQCLIYLEKTEQLVEGLQLPLK
ncbi:unnamed protein product [Prunus armeniaca]|uniref:Myb/SANT-like domain-containing protein n=1 Tax=Prunus armeniaca TaxID=36596 RepID=A0A6J5X7J1_PRUAR|nr:unnamed protein product [Prunus armeniaca]CAB4308821.1 unnamed protein product [Prunus armeniaca]